MTESATAQSFDRSVPEPGQLAEVRRRQWVVTNVHGWVTSAERASSQNLVSLTSIDEDALGEKLEVTGR